FMVGVVLFTLASLLCGLAWSDKAVSGGRGFQGIGAAVMTPSALSIITTTFEEGPERNKALGIWGALGGIGATTAWLIGGPIVDGLGWAWIFFINIPVGRGRVSTHWGSRWRVASAQVARTVRPGLPPSKPSPRSQLARLAGR